MLLLLVYKQNTIFEYFDFNFSKLFKIFYVFCSCYFFAYFKKLTEMQQQRANKTSYSADSATRRHLALAEM